MADENYISIDLASQTGQQAIAAAITNLSEFLSSLGRSNNGNTITTKAIVTKAIINLSSVWSGEDPYTQIITIPSLSIDPDSKIDLQPDYIVINQLIADGVKSIYIQNDNGILTCYCIGGHPSTPVSIQCTILSIHPVMTSIIIESEPTKTIYTVGDSLDLSGLKVVANYSDDTSSDITSGCILNYSNGDVLSDIGTHNIFIIYYENDIIKYTSFTITVNNS